MGVVNIINNSFVCIVADCSLWRESIDPFNTRRPQSRSSLPVVEMHAMNVIISSRRKHSSSGCRTLVALVILTLFVVVATFVHFLPDKALMISQSKVGSSLHGTEHKWHGGHPAQNRPGSCWCSGDNYCMCTPSVAIDIVLYSQTTQSIDGYNVWVVRRADTGQLATIGG